MTVVLSVLVGIAGAGAAAVILRGSHLVPRFLRFAVPAAARPRAGARLSSLSRLLRARRVARVREQLPAALGTISTSVRAGLSLPQALQAASEQVPDPAGGELRTVVAETRMASTLDEALDRLGARVPLPEVGFLVSGLKLSRATGGNLAPLLDRLAETLRERERLRGQFRTLTAQARLSGWVVGLTPVALLAIMSVLDPEFVAPLWGTGAGWVLLGVAALLEILGVLAIRAVVRTEP